MSVWADIDQSDRYTVTVCVDIDQSDRYTVTVCADIDQSHRTVTVCADIDQSDHYCDSLAVTISTNEIVIVTTSPDIDQSDLIVTGSADRYFRDGVVRLCIESIDRIFSLYVNMKPHLTPWHYAFLLGITSKSLGECSVSRWKVRPTQ